LPCPHSRNGHRPVERIQTVPPGETPGSAGMAVRPGGHPVESLHDRGRRRMGSDGVPMRKTSARLKPPARVGWAVSWSGPNPAVPLDGYGPAERAVRPADPLRAGAYREIGFPGIRCGSGDRAPRLAVRLADPSSIFGPSCRWGIAATRPSRFGNQTRKQEDREGPLPFGFGTDSFGNAPTQSVGNQTNKPENCEGPLPFGFGTDSLGNAPTQSVGNQTQFQIQFRSLEYKYGCRRERMNLR
jgi:hypothetical protein